MLKPTQIKELLETEAAALQSLMQGQGIRKPSKRLHVSVPEFVERCFKLHRGLIERWGGWRYQGAEMLVEDPSFVRGIANQEWTAFVRSVQTATREGKIPPEWGMLANFSFDGPNYTIHAPLLLSAKNLLEQYGVDVGSGRIFYEKLEPKHGYSIPYAQVTKASKTPHELAYYGPTVRKVLSAKVRVGQRISAAVIDGLKEEGAPEELVSLWEKLFQRLGEQCWGSTSVPVRCVLSCAPSSFIRLGEYGENSCYQSGGGSENSKFWLASDCANSFVALFHRMKPRKEGEPENREEAKQNAEERRLETDKGVNGRAWGVACPERGALLSNFYLLPQNMVLPALKSTLAGGLGISNIDIARVPDRGSSWSGELSQSVYLNGDTQMFVDSKSETKKKLFEHYLTHILAMGRFYGFFSNGGAGPQFIKAGNNAWDIVGPQRTPRRYSALWPYKDAVLKDLLIKAIADDGVFSPLKGPVYEG